MTHAANDAPVEREHVAAFIDWYAARVPTERWPGVEEMWWNALKTLTVGELRHGMKSFKRFTTPMHLSPPQFWALCKGTASELSIQRFAKLRETIAKGTIKVAPQHKPKREQDKPGASHD